MVLAVDIGTTFLKIAIIDYYGEVCFREKKKLEVVNDGELYEVSPLQWELGLRELCLLIPKEVVSTIDSVVISGNGPTIVPKLISGDKEIVNGVLWKDLRAKSVTKEISGKLGQFTPPNFFLSKVFYIKKAFPDLYENTESFFSCPEYLSYRLTGESYTILPQEGFKPFYWDEDKLDRLDLDKNKFPDFSSPFKVYGNYKVNGILGDIDRGIPIICAGPDFTMSLLGSGSVEDGILCDRTGTSEGLNFCSEEKIYVDGLRTLPHIERSFYTLAGLIPNSGDLVYKGEISQLLKEYESIIDKMRSAGLNIREVRIIGGHSDIKSLNIKKSKLFKVPVRIYSSGAELIGNAVLGSVVTGVYKDILTACKAMVREVFCYNER